MLKYRIGVSIVRVNDNDDEEEEDDDEGQDDSAEWGNENANQSFVE